MSESITIPVKVMRVGKHLLRFGVYQFKIIDRPNFLQTNYIVFPAGTFLSDSGYACVSVSGNIWYAPKMSKQS